MIKVNKVSPYILDTLIDSESKRFQYIPAHASSPIQLSDRVWGVSFATLQKGHDGTHSIILQLRDASFDGKIIKEKIIAKAQHGQWADSRRLRKVMGMPQMFGVKKGTLVNGQAVPHENIFVIKWYTVLIPEDDDGNTLPTYPTHEDERLHQIRMKSLRIEWMQFRLNIVEDNIEVLAPNTLLCERGFDKSDKFCSIEDAAFMNHAMTPPQPIDEDMESWLSCETFAELPEKTGYLHGKIATVLYCWNSVTKLYEWVQSGTLFSMPGRPLGECSVRFLNEEWIISARCFHADGVVAWFRTSNPFEPLSDPILVAGEQGPKYNCTVGNSLIHVYSDTTRGHRNPLYAAAVFPNESFRLGQSTPLFDAEQRGLGFPVPYIDMPKFVPGSNDTFSLLVRVIDNSMTSHRPLCSLESLAHAGIYNIDCTLEGGPRNME